MSLVTYRRGFMMVGVVVKHSKAKLVKQERRKRLKGDVGRAAIATIILLC